MEKQIKIKGVNINYTQGGNGSPIILMHGWDSDHAALSLFERIGREQHEVFNLDLPGFGKSEEPPTPWGIDEYREMLEEFVKELNIKDPILLGHSFGGRIAISYAAKNPVHKLVLVDAAGVKPRRGIKYYSKVYSYKLAKSIYPFLVGKKRADAYIERMRSKRGSTDYKNSSPMMRRVMVKVVNEDLRRLMPNIKAQTLLIWGENDTATPMRDAHIMNRLIPNSTLISFPGAGHFSFIDNPFQTASILRRFIQAEEIDSIHSKEV